MFQRALICLLLGLFFYVILFSAAAKAHAETAEKIAVHINGTGFNPKNLEISEGKSVIFENMDDEPHWPASNIHPTHAIYPEFDPKAPIPPAESWSFVFKKVGVWRFHDHLFPEFIGTITVTPVQGADLAKNVSNQKITFSIKATLSNVLEAITADLMKAYFSAFPKQMNIKLKSFDIHELLKSENDLSIWLRILGPKQIMSELVNQSRGGSAFDCHQEAHRIGRTSYKILGAESFREGDSNCHSGFYHGAMEALLIDKGTADVAATTDEICRLFDTNFTRFECLHGIGHGVMAYAGYDLPLALNICGQLNSNFSQRSCYGGAFMENIVASQGLGCARNHDTRWVNSDPHFPCSSLLNLTQSVLIQCYLMQTSRMLMLYNNSFDKVAKECLKVPSEYVSVCFRSLGRDAASRTLRNASQIVSLCNKIPRVEGFTYYYNQCIGGALSVIVDFWGPNLKGQATELCKILAVPFKENCYHQLTNRIKDVFMKPSDKNLVCQIFESEYKQNCLLA